MFGRRSFLRALFIGAAVAFPVAKLKWDDGLTEAERLAQRIANTTGRTVMLFVTGQSNITGSDYTHLTANPTVFNWSANGG